MALIWRRKKLSVTDIRGKLTVTTALLRFFVPVPRQGSEEEIEMVDERGWKYNFRLKVRPINSLGRNYRKAEFQLKEWKAFVAEKRLKKNDMVYFWRDGMNNIRVQARVPPF